MLNISVASKIYNFLKNKYTTESPFCCDTESPSGICTKLRSVAASNNRDHAPRSLYYCLFAPHICIVVLRAHPVRGESHNHATSPERLQHYTHSRGRKEHGYKNLTHTSKTRQVKRPKWLQLLGSRFECLLLFQTVKNRTQRNHRAKGCEV